MTPEAQLVLKQAVTRKDLLHRLSEGGSHIRRQPLKTRIVDTISDIFIADIEVHGIENLNKATNLLDRGDELTVIGNHSSDGDPALRRAAFTRVGYKAFADRLIWVAGLSMMERWYTRVFMGCDEAVLVVTPFDLRRIRGVLENEVGFTPEEEGLVKNYEQSAHQVNKSANRTASARRRDGFAVSIFPESTRSRNNGLLQEAQRETAIFFPRGYVLPVAAVGIREIVPVNGSFHLKRANARVDIGEPVPAAEIWKKSVRFFNGGRHNPAEVAMAYVGVLNPDIIPEGKKTYYKQLLAT